MMHAHEKSPPEGGAVELVDAGERVGRDLLAVQDLHREGRVGPDDADEAEAPASLRMGAGSPRRTDDAGAPRTIREKTAAPLARITTT